MIEIYIAIGAIVGAYITIALALWGVVYQNGKLKELVKQKEEEIKRYKMERDVCSLVIQQAIDNAKSAIASGDIEKMISSLKLCQECE
jgi:hypothetical protein